MHGLCTSLISTEPGRSFCHSYYGRWIGNRIQAFVRRHFQRPWRTPTPGFKVTTLFDAEYLRNGMRCRHSFNGILTGAYIRPTQQCQMILSDLEWLSKIFNDSKHRAASLRQQSYLLSPKSLGEFPWDFRYDSWSRGTRVRAELRGGENSVKHVTDGNVRPCVRLSRSGIVSKRLNTSSFNYVSGPDHSSLASKLTKHLYQILTGSSPTGGGVECRWGMQISRFATSIWL